MDKCGGLADWLACKKGSIDGISWGFLDGKTCFDAFSSVPSKPSLARELKVAGDAEIKKICPGNC